MRKHWLHDDYVKFIRYGQHFVEKNGEGILAYVNNHSFIDNPTFRGMRWNLMNTFDEIYILDLHGSSKRGLKAENGERDKNVFDIQQGVSINIFVKKSTSKKGLADIYKANLIGPRNMKYDFLNQNSLKEIDFSLIKNESPYYFFVEKDYSIKDEYLSDSPQSLLQTSNGQIERDL